MPQLILIDHSLKGVGGHHYEYASSILRAAATAGWDLVLATHVRFRKHRASIPHCRVFPLYRHETYCEHSVLTHARGLPKNPYSELPNPESANSSGRGSLIGRLRCWFNRGKQRRCLDTFVRHCHEVFKQLEVRAGDQVFIPTCSEFDLVGVIEFLKSFPRGRQLDWHLQFHFNFLDGAEPDYPRQAARLAAMRDHFSHLLQQVPEFRLHFYTTTDQMSAQYNLLEAAQFAKLPYPIRGDFQPVPRPLGEPLRVLCAGSARSEKGTHHLQPLLHSLWEEFFGSGKLQFLVQAKNRRLLPQPPASATGHQNAWTPVVHVPHPLAAKDYCRLICEADIGLFLYDRERYYARCSGVLVEMLCAGVPVIVPAGCWLAEEIAELNYHHLHQLAAAAEVVSEAHPESQTHTDDTYALSLAVPAFATELWLSFSRNSPSEPGRYLRLECTQFDEQGKALGSSAVVVGHRNQNQPIPVLFHLREPTRRLKLLWREAYQQGPVVVKDVDLRFLRGQGLGGHDPAGSVGLIAADQEQVPAMLRDMTTNYEHYRRRALEYSSRYRKLHDPARVFEQILAPASGESSGRNTRLACPHFAIKPATAPRPS